MAKVPICSITKDLYEGVKGRKAQVKCLQRTLNNWRAMGAPYVVNYGPPISQIPVLAIDGKFGPLTRKVVMKFQRSRLNVFPIPDRHPSIDGYVGPETRRWLKRFIPKRYVVVTPVVRR